MKNYVTIAFVIFSHVAICKDFYVGMFKKNDLLVAQDRFYKERVPFRNTYAKYGRVFNCKITYFRVVDRLGYRPGPKVQIVRGGLSHKYLVLRMISPYNLPISVNIYVGCANIFTSTTELTGGNTSDTTTVNTTNSQNTSDATTLALDKSANSTNDASSKSIETTPASSTAPSPAPAN